MALTKYADVLRHRQFKKDVDDLMNTGHLRRYTAEIKAKTGESTGNIANFYKGDKPVSDNFLGKFRKAYGPALKQIRPGLSESVPHSSLQVSDKNLVGYYNLLKVVFEKLTEIEKLLQDWSKRSNDNTSMLQMTVSVFNRFLLKTNILNGKK